MNGKSDMIICISLYNMLLALEVQILNLKYCVLNSGLDVIIKYFDDGSAESSRGEAEAICKKHGVEYQWFEHKGFGSVCNKMGSEAGRADYCLILDSDVFLPDYFLRSASQLMNLKRDSVGLFSFKSLRVTLDSMMQYKVNPNYADLVFLNRESYWSPYKPPEADTELATYSFLFTEYEFMQAKGFNESYQAYYSDSDFCCRLASKEIWTYRLHFPYVFHVEHLTLEDPTNKFNLSEVRKKDLATFKTNWGGKTPPQVRDLLLRGER